LGIAGSVEPASIVTFAVAVGWEVMALTARHATCSLTEPLAHKDPFDELLMVQAQVEGMRLLTRDAKLLGHPLAAA
jgi:PIN domain nuclease of toxin-antitoxin system